MHTSNHGSSSLSFHDSTTNNPPHCCSSNNHSRAAAHHPLPSTHHHIASIRRHPASDTGNHHRHREPERFHELLPLRGKADDFRYSILCCSTEIRYHYSPPPP